MASKYTDKDRAYVYTVLDANEGNVKRTARETGLAVQTVRDWKKKRDRDGGLPAAIEAELPAAQEEFTGNATRVRNKMLMRLEQKTDLDKVSPRDLLVGVGILTDKVRLIEGKPTSQVEHSGSAGNLPVEQVRELFAGFAKGMLEAAHERAQAISSAVEGEEPIEDGEWEQAAKALPAPAS